MSERNIGILEYDGINLFINNKWTGLEFKTLDEGWQTIAFLKTLTNEQQDEWIRLETYKKDAARGKTWNVLTAEETISDK